MVYEEMNCQSIGWTFCRSISHSVAILSVAKSEAIVGRKDGSNCRSQSRSQSRSSSSRKMLSHDMTESAGRTIMTEIAGRSESRTVMTEIAGRSEIAEGLDRKPECQCHTCKAMTTFSVNHIRQQYLEVRDALVTLKGWYKTRKTEKAWLRQQVKAFQRVVRKQCIELRDGRVEIAELKKEMERLDEILGYYREKEDTELKREVKWMEEVWEEGGI